ncbi:unnamed protein product [Clavelina lepadiformis]|uniref:HTH CENPB-type domain-containing protein n=1 Tax=Clavelina lepadiformis TaxID=159417 RepID=A0ABP0FXT1_CLALP
MKKAIDDIKNKKLSIRQAAEHGVPKSTLERHWKGRVVHPGKVNLGKYKQALNSDLEEELVEHVKKMQEMFFGLTGETLRALAFQLANANGIPVPFNINNQKAGKDWLSCFLKRHPDLSLRQPEPTSLSRATGFNRTQVGRFFDLLKGIYEKEAITVENVYNVDETGITCVQKPGKIIAKKGMKQVGRITSAERGKTITAVCAMSAIGNYVPPIFIFPRKRMAMGLLQDAPSGSRGFASPSGWIDSEIFLDWLKHFKKYANPSIDKKVLLILDNHASHLNLPAIEFARQNGIIMLSIPPHTSHRLQLLDRTFFGPLKTYYNQAIDHWMVTNYGKRVQSSQVCGFFCTAYSKAATVQKAVNGFKSAGIMPFNPDIFDETDFAPSMVTEIHAVGSPELEAHGATTSSLAEVEGVTSIQLCNNTITSSQTAAEREGVAGMQRSGDYAPSDQVSAEREGVASMQRSGDSTTSDQAAAEGLGGILLSDGPTTSAQIAVQSEVQLTDGPSTRVHVMDISPLPDAKLTTRKRKAMKSQVLTSSPFKKILLSKSKVPSSNKRIHKRNKKQLQFPGSYECLICSELYIHPPKEDWIQCSLCKKWCHENCSAYPGHGNFVCDFCAKK